MRAMSSVAFRQYHDPFLFSRANESEPRRRCRDAKFKL
jgi:hypothetical protein